MSQQDELERVMDALVHLHETHYLQTHPLAEILAATAPMPSRGQALRTHLCTAIERLRPPTGTPAHALAWRQYRCLSLRHLQEMSFHTVAIELGMTERHCRRIYREALLALASLLFRHENGAPARSTPTGAATGRQLLESEIDRVGTAPERVASVTQTIHGIVQTLQALASANGVTLVASECPIVDVCVERAILRQVLLNVIVHAIHAEPGARIGVDARCDSRIVTIDVRVEPRAGSPASGLLGAATEEHLAIAHRVARLRDVAVEHTRQPTYACFTLSVGASRPAAVLLIDDNPDLRRLFRRFATSAGYHVHEASTGEQAFQTAREVRPDAIVLDILMPHQDGWEILQFLKNDRQTEPIPVIICSVLHDRDLAVSLGASDFISKPVTRSAFLDALQRSAPAPQIGSPVR